MDGHIETIALHETGPRALPQLRSQRHHEPRAPDVRDGLKPVQRRILYGLHRLRLVPDGRYRKSAKVVGDVMGAYHPHGDSAIYDAMVRMAQPLLAALRARRRSGQLRLGRWRRRQPAMRYTEARMAKISSELLADLDSRNCRLAARTTTPKEQEPGSPADQGSPNLLVNGAIGHRRGYGDQYSAPQPARGHRRVRGPHRPPRRGPRAGDARAAGAGLPDRRAASSTRPSSCARSTRPDAARSTCAASTPWSRTADGAPSS